MKYVNTYQGKDFSASHQFRLLAEVISQLDEIPVPTLNQEPARPRDGMVVIADGSDWDPLLTGAETLVVRIGGVWLEIGTLGITSQIFLDITKIDVADASYYYYGGVDSVADWKINRYDKTTYVKTSADENNNGGYTDLATAWTDRTTLTYA